MINSILRLCPTAGQRQEDFGPVGYIKNTFSFIGFKLNILVSSSNKHYRYKNILNTPFHLRNIYQTLYRSHVITASA